MNYPAMEALGEFRIMTSNYSAENGTAGSGVVAVVTKSGGQDFHGSLYYLHRNDAADAANFFASIGPDGEKNKPPLKRNNFGYTVGGPIFIPGLYNEDKTKDFFFWSQEWKKRRQGLVLRAATPTAAMRAGISARSPLRLSTLCQEVRLRGTLFPRHGSIPTPRSFSTGFPIAQRNDWGVH